MNKPCKLVLRRCEHFLLWHQKQNSKMPSVLAQIKPANLTPRLLPLPIAILDLSGFRLHLWNGNIEGYPKWAYNHIHTPWNITDTSTYWETTKTDNSGSQYMRWLLPIHSRVKFSTFCFMMKAVISALFSSCARKTKLWFISKWWRNFSPRQYPN